MKKILLLLISLTILYFGDGVYASDFSTGGRGNYIVEDNTKDGVHDSMADTLIDIGTKYLDGTISPEEARRQLSEYINQVSGGGASAEAHFDSNGGLHIGCTNNGSLIVLRPIGGGLGGSSSGGRPPVVTTSTTTNRGGACSTYISNWIANWSECNASGYNWSNQGSIKCKQTNTWSPVSSSCGSMVYTTTTTCVDGVCSDATTSSCDASSCPGDTPKPADQIEEKTLSINLNTPKSTTNNAYANDNDTNDVTLTTTISTNQSKSVVNIPHNITDITDTSGLKSNRINNTGGKALNFSSVVGGALGTIGNGTNDYIKITGVKGYAPLQVNNGKLSFKIGGTQMEINNIGYHFNKPFTGYIQTWDDIKNNWQGSASIGTQNKYKLLLNQKSSLTWSGLSGYTMNDFSAKIQPNGAEIEIQSSSVSGATLTSKTGTEFYSRINTSAQATQLNQIPGIQINLPEISYTLGGQTVKYYLSEQDSPNDATPIKTTGSEFMGVRVIGGIQGAGKSEFTGQQANISNLYNSEQRTLIRKAAYEYVKNMSSRQIINGVKYVQGDEKISNITPDVETLVVVDGNVIFDEDFIPTQLKGIIVLKDNYDVSTGYTGKGNIYIMPDVSQINAIIYADGGLISVNASGVPYVQDSIERTQALKNQLFLNGSIFTRNTIGGGILAGGEYILPGGTKTQNFDIAMIYDLNYIRRANVGCDKNSNNNCTDSGEYKDPFVIKYDARVQSNPPKLFAQ